MPESLFPDSRTAILESLRRLGIQRQRARFGDRCCYAIDGSRMEDGKSLYCAIGILLPPEEAEEWQLNFEGIDSVPDHAIVRLAPDADYWSDAWDTLQYFHDKMWNPEGDLSPEQQLKECMATGNPMIYDSIRKLLDGEEA